ncbi:hypothetical protein OHB26_39665 (plasmid) [Nocardia sp. NBC_01503]|uniref:hypothetical protein n=1 Tax=Nocardia sp. NBC_01503 TaxID=2975997 RepID=UPI002E7BEABE|nr:hypothetical protein [Nocardia sp. NBC_01503]WTL36650.1 hypothetical protein OHB26_38910 [Nocardia sp. NBC_01503]WTL36797.1 hypothetical protein OHB26_39665 [Nocardia sp. NBC_01503]
MGVKGATAGRTSITTKPTVEKLVEDMAEKTHITKSDLFNIGIDILHFVWTVLAKGGVIGVKLPGDDEFKPVQIYIPGMTQPFTT